MGDIDELEKLKDTGELTAEEFIMIKNKLSENTENKQSTGKENTGINSNYKVCTKCNNLILESENFCSKCGASVKGKNTKIMKNKYWIFLIIISISIILFGVVSAISNVQKEEKDQPNISLSNQKTNEEIILEVIDKANKEFKINGMDLITALIKAEEEIAKEDNTALIDAFKLQYKKLNDSSNTGFDEYAIGSSSQLRGNGVYPALLIGVSQSSNKVAYIGVGYPYDGYTGKTFSTSVITYNYRLLKTALNSMGYTELWNTIETIWKEGENDSTKAEIYFDEGLNGVCYGLIDGFKRQDGTLGGEYCVFKIISNGVEKDITEEEKIKESGVTIGANYICTTEGMLGSIRFTTETDFFMELGMEYSEGSQKTGNYKINGNTIELTVTYDSDLDYSLYDPEATSTMDPYQTKLTILDDGTLKYITDTNYTVIFDKNDSSTNEKNTGTSNLLEEQISIDIDKFIKELSYKSLSTVQNANYGGDGYRYDSSFYNEGLNKESFEITNIGDKITYTLKTNGNSSYKYPFILTIVTTNDNILSEISITCQPQKLNTKGILDCAAEVEDALGYTLYNKRNSSITETVKSNLINLGYIDSNSNAISQNVETTIDNQAYGKNIVFKIGTDTLIYDMIF